MANTHQFQDQADREWLTWRQVCKQLEKLGINPNDKKYNALMTAIRLWGEEQTQLTESCGDAGAVHHEAQLRTLRDTYEPHVLDGWAP